MQVSSFFPVAPTLPRVSVRTARAIKLALILALVLMACVRSSGKGNATSPTATPSIIISSASGPPTTNLTAAGSGFDTYAAVDIYFDFTDLALVVTNGAGEFGGSAIAGIPLQVPRSAVPGNHWITAVERWSTKAAQKQFLVRSDWAQFHFSPDHKGVNPYENVLSPTTVGKLRLRWSYQANAGIASSAVVNGVLYISGGRYQANDAYLAALNATTGAPLWTQATTDDGGHSVAVANNLVYFHYSIDGMMRTYLAAYDANTGALVWAQQTNAPGHGGIAGSVTVASGAVFVAAEHNAAAYDAMTGAELWGNDYGCDSISTPAVANGLMYFGTICGAMMALDATTGQGDMLFATTPGFLSSSPAVANGMLYIGSDDGVYAWNGFMRWIFGTGAFNSSPAVANGVVYIGSDDGNLYGLDANAGTMLWQFPAGAAPSLAVANGVVYVGSVNGQVYALSAKTGAVLWQYATGSPGGPTAVVNGMLYVGSANGNLYAFGPSAPERPDPRRLVPDYSLQPGTAETTSIGAH
jgi:outer membrane protein assembly factor BamB